MSKSSNPPLEKRLICISSFLAIILILGLSTASGQVPPFLANPHAAAPPPLPAGSAPVLSWNYYAYGGLYQNGNMWTVPGSGGAFLNYFTVSADTKSITFDYSTLPAGTDKTWSASGLSLPPTIHNGIAINALSGTVIESVDINPATNMAGFDAARISFTGSQIQVDWVGLPFNPRTIVKLDVGFKGYPSHLNRHAVGDFDHDDKDEVALDFGPAGIWLYDQGNWMQLAPENPEGLLAWNNHRLIAADFGSQGLWMWSQGIWMQSSAADVESMAEGRGYTGGSDPSQVLIGDFGALGLWQWGNGRWGIESGEDAEGIIEVSAMHIADFGSLGLWRTDHSFGAPSAPMSGANADHMVKRRLLSGAERLICDFGVLGLWEHYWSLIGGVWTEVWTNLTAADADFVAPADIDADGVDEIVGDFGGSGLWLLDTQWTQLSDADAQYLIGADVTGDGSDEIAVDFGPNGIWIWNNGPWSQITTMDPQYLLAADTNGDGAKEILADFGASGLWMWNGAWAQISEDNPD
jgi:hypothetical protein